MHTSTKKAITYSMLQFPLATLNAILCIVLFSAITFFC